LQLWFKGKSLGDDDSLNSQQKEARAGRHFKEICFAGRCPVSSLKGK
jgi:hypothetical protein